VLPPLPPSRAGILAGKVLFPICTALFGVLTLPTVYLLDRNDETERAAAIAIFATILAFILYETRRRLLAGLLAIPIGLVLLAKPFVRPVMYDGHPLSLNSETHYYFLIPGFCMVFVFGWMFLAAYNRDDPAPADGRALRTTAGILFVAGALLGHVLFGGLTYGDVIREHTTRGLAIRQQLLALTTQLPAPGHVEPIETKLLPSPTWLYDRRVGNNIEIVGVTELLNLDDTPKFDNFYFSSDLVYCLQRTGPKNPMDWTMMHKQAGDFTAVIDQAFGLPWVATYRPGTNGIEVFVFDMRNNRLAAATVATGTSGNIEDRNLVLKALARATGGTFQLK
jgi:hypothetical protein